MKNLAEFKRELIVGSAWQFFNSRTNESATRIVSQVKSKTVAFLRPDSKESWLEYPKASDCVFDGDTIRINFGDSYLTYTKVTTKPIVIMECGHATNDDCLCK